MKISCKIAEDLLPLYYDEICSDDSRRAVEEHLEKCEQCSMLLKKMGSTVTVDYQKDIRPLQDVQNVWLKIKKRASLKGLICSLCICLALVLGFIGLTQWIILPVSTNKMQVSDLCVLDDGDIAFHLFIDDKYDLNAVLCDITDEGIMYITPKRAVIEGKRWEGLKGLYDRDYVVSLTPDYKGISDFSFTEGTTPKAVYLGTEKDHIVIWEEGKDIPAAGFELQERFTDDINS